MKKLFALISILLIIQGVGVCKYKIREIIPEGAINVEPDIYYKDYVRYDGIRGYVFLCRKRE